MQADFSTLELSSFPGLVTIPRDEKGEEAPSVHERVTTRHSRKESKSLAPNPRVGSARQVLVRGTIVVPDFPATGSLAQSQNDRNSGTNSSSSFIEV